MVMGRTLKKFNPIDMSREDVMALATGREKLLKTMMAEMKHSVQSKTSQHFVLSGPRGIGKSFFIRLLNIHHDDSEKFKKSIFIQFPEELDNIRYVSDLMDKIANKLEGGFYVDSKPRWEMNEAIWNASKKRLTAALKKITKDKKEHVFIGLENLQDFIPKLDDMENGRMREFLSNYPQVTLIGSSLRPDLDSNYNKKLFQVFKKIDITPWSENDFIEFYKRKADLSPNKEAQKNQLSISKNKIKAIATFTGGSPRLAVILSSLVLDQKILETAALLNNILDDLTAFYQDLTKDIPPKSKALFDMLIRIGENVTQSELAQSFSPALEQKTISRSFKWLLDNYYVVNKKQARGNAKHYHVRDRLYVLYYQKRQVFADQLTSFVGVFVDFLTEYFSVKEWREQLEKMDMADPYSKRIMLCYPECRGLKMEESADAEFIKSSIFLDIEKEEQGGIEQLIINLEKAISLNPEGAAAYYNISLLYYKDAKWADAEHWILAGVNAVPSDKMLLQKLLELYLIQSKWQAISQFNQKSSDGITKDILLGRALVEAIAHEQVEQFLLFKQTLDFIQDKHPEWLIGFVIALTMHLYVGEKKELLDSFVDELGVSENNNPFLNIILECWRYLQNPEDQDISKLHPDARLVANRILDLEKVD